MEKLIIKKIELERVLSDVNSVIDIKAIIPALSYAYISVTKDKLTAIGSTKEVHITSSTSDITATSDITMLIESLDIAKLLPKLQDIELTIEYSKTQFIIKSISGEYKYPIISDGDEYPLVTKDNPTDEVELDLLELKAIIKKCKASIEVNELRPIMSTVGIISDGNKLKFFGSTMASIIRCVYNNVETSISSHLPFVALSIIPKIKGSVIRLKVCDKTIILSNDNFTASFVKSESVYPNADKYLVEYPEYLIVDRDEFISNLDRVLLSSTEIGEVYINISTDKLQFKSVNVEKARNAEANIDCITTINSDKELYFNGHRILNLAKEIDGKYLQVGISSDRTMINMQGLTESKVLKPEIFSLIVGLTKV